MSPNELLLSNRAGDQARVENDLRRQLEQAILERNRFQDLEAVAVAALTASQQEVAALKARVGELESAIKIHHANVWGDGKASHDADTVLYEVMRDCRDPS